MVAIHPRLLSDTALITDWDLCRVLLMNDRTYPWLILVPRRDAVTEIGDLAPADRAVLIEEIARASDRLRALVRPDRINVAALGNVVAQLHVHVVARFEGDAAWPGPIWGARPPERFEPESLVRRVAEMQAALAV